MRRRLMVILGALCAVCLGAWGIATSVAPRASVTCTNQAGVTRTWTSPAAQIGGSAGTVSASATAPIQVSAVDKSGPLPPPMTLAQLRWVMVGSSIDDRMDPVTAARLFGPWTAPGAMGAQLAHAMDPATYGWHCRAEERSAVRSPGPQEPRGFGL